MTDQHSKAGTEILPPPIRRGRGRALLLISAGFVLAVMLLLVVLNLDSKPAQPAWSKNRDPAIELVAPDKLNTQDLDAAGTNIRANGQSFVAEQGGQINVTDPRTGNLAQSYAFSKLVPNPDGKVGWSQLSNPLIQIYLADNRVLTLRSTSAEILAPNGKSPEEGTMTGDVVIRLYDDIVGRQVDEATDLPQLEVLTAKAMFNNFQGEVRCPGDVDIQTSAVHLPGTGLRLQINDREKRPEWFSIDHPGAIRMAMNKAAATPGQTQPASSRPRNPSASAPSSSRPDRGAATEAAGSQPSRKASAATAPQGGNPRPPATKPAPPQFYLLTLTDNVHIQQGDGTRGWTARGDDLSVIFSMKGGDLLVNANNSTQGAMNAVAQPIARIARAGTNARTSTPIGGPTPVSLAALAFSALPQSQPDGVIHDRSTGGLFHPSEDDTLITCRGPLKMVPLVNGASRPASADDSRFELSGKPVQLHNSAESVEVQCSSLVYQSLNQRLTLDGTSEIPLTIDSPELHASGRELWVSRLENNGAFVGPGFMTTGSRPPATAPSSSSSEADDIRIAWTEGVDMLIEPGEDASSPSKGRLRQATFRGGIDVVSTDVLLRSDRLEIGFPPALKSGGRRTIKSLLAEGAVHAQSVHDQGMIDCGRLAMEFVADAQGKTTPVQMTADTDVAATDADRQMVFCRHLEIAFLPPGAAAPDGGSRIQRAAGKVSTLTATDDVQVLLADGARAFASRLEADAANDTAVLFGPNITVINDRSIARGGARLELRRSDRKATWPGQGEFAYHAAAIAPPTRARIDRPIIDENLNPRQLQASWAKSMVYDSLANDGAGSILLDGGVHGQSTPSTLELNTISAASLLLDFSNRPGDGPAVVAATGPAGGFDPMSGGRRQLRQLVAKGDAKLESRTWLKPDHADVPRVFYLAGPSVSYNDQTLESVVDGEGELLVRDESAAPPASTRPQQSTPFSTKGTTLFRWKKRLEMTRQTDANYLVTMFDAVEIRHMGTDHSLSTLTGDRLEATVARSAGKAPPTAKAHDSGFDLGGSMDLLRLQGSGGILIDSPTRNIQCDAFDYNYATGIATLTAQDPHTVLVTTRNNPHPIRAGSVIWNILEDKITATNVSGAAPR